MKCHSVAQFRLPGCLQLIVNTWLKAAPSLFQMAVRWSTRWVLYDAVAERTLFYWYFIIITLAQLLTSSVLLNIMFHAPMGRFQLEFIYYYTYFSTVFASNMLYIGSFCPAMISLSRFSEVAAFIYINCSSCFYLYSKPTLTIKWVIIKQKIIDGKYFKTLL